MWELARKIREGLNGGGATYYDRTVRAVLDGSIASIEEFETRIAIAEMESRAGDIDGKICILTDDFLGRREAFEQNRYRCLPLLRDALDGSSEARSRYEQNRLCTVAFAPPYAQAELGRQCFSECQKLKPTRIAPGESALVRRAFSTWINGYQDRPNELFAAIGLNLALTASITNRVVEHFSARTYSPMLTFVDREDGARIAAGNLTPASEGPLGQLGLTGWRHAYRLLLASTIVEDILGDLQLSLNGLPQLKAIQACRSPWDVCDSVFIRNCRHLASLRDTNALTPEAYDRILRRPERLTSPNFLREAEEIQLAIAAKKEREAQRADAINPIPAMVQHRTVPTADEFFAALEGAAQRVSDRREFRAQHRPLFSLFKKGRLSLDQCLEAVREGTRVSDVVQKARDSIGSVHVDRGEHRSILRRLAGTLAGRPAEPERDTQQGYAIIGREAKWFVDWRTSLGPVERKLVDSRLERAEEEGVFGNYGQLREDTRLFQFRFFTADGKRLFFCFPDDNVIMLLGAASKDEQDRTVRDLAAKLDTLLARWEQSGRG
jgi:hypothetical protein